MGDQSALQGYASTDLINKLLEKLKTESNTYKRNKKTSLAIHEQSGVIYTSLVALVKKIVEIPADSATIPDWDDYEHSHTGITGLEDYLLKLLFDGHDLAPTMKKDQEKDLATAIAFANTWKAHSTSLVTTTEGLNTLAAPSAPAKTLVTDASGFKKNLFKGQREDHQETVQAILADMSDSEFTLKDTDITGIEEGDEHVKGVKDAVGLLSKGLEAEVPDDFDFAQSKAMGTIVAGVMLLQIPFLINRLAEKGGAAVDEHFKSAKLWGPAKTFADDLLKFFEDIKNTKLEDLEKKYTDFVAVLNAASLGPWIPQILTMMRLSANVRRPFYGRSVALVRIWYTMNNASEVMKNENNEKARAGLHAAFKETIAAIRTATEEIKGFDEDMEATIETVGNTYTDTFKTVGTMIDKYGGEKKEDLKKFFTEAQATDEAHLKDFRAKASFLKAAMQA